MTDEAKALRVRCRLATVSVAACLALVLAGPARGEEPDCWPAPPGTEPATCPPDDPGYASRWEFRGDIPPEIDRSRMHPAEVALGAIGFSLDRAWQWTIGRDDVVVAVLDSGIRWPDGDLRRKHYLNSGELPVPAGAAEHDANGDGLLDVEDYASDPRVGDRNGNGLLDPGDLIAAFSDCQDDDGNGYADDISGYDFFSGAHCGRDGGDNDPSDETDFGHGTGIAQAAAAAVNDGQGEIGVCPRCRVLSVRVGDSFVVDANQFARGVVFAVRSGAAVIASALGSYDNTPAARRAVDFAWEHGVPVIASAADEYSYHHNYPSLYERAFYVNAIRYNGRDDWRSATTFWGLNPCTNFGARVQLTVPATSCSSGATARLAGIVGLMQSMALDTHGQLLHAEEVYQTLRATADDLDNSEPDWGDLRWPAKRGFDQLTGYGRVHAARAVRAVALGLIPPIVDLDGPRWFEIVSPVRSRELAVTGSIRLPRAASARWELAYALGVDPAESDYHGVGAGSAAGSYSGRLGLLDFTKLPQPVGAPPRSREERDRYSVTLRLRVTDDGGRVAESRRSFFVLHDPTWKESFPIDLGCSGEAPPTLADLDGDGRDEIIVPGADGRLRILRTAAAGVATTLLPLDEVAPIDPLARAPAAERVLDPMLRAAVVGRRSGGHGLRIVVASRSGRVYAFGNQGERLAGFPVAIDGSGRASPQRRVETGFFSTPLLVDLDGDGSEEIVIGALDGQLWAWHEDGKRVAGFPVELSNPARPPKTVDKIVSSPAAGDLDGDGRLEIVVGSNGLRGGFAAAYAVRAAGHADPAGPFLDGWPVEVPGLRPDLLPTVASGVQMTPQLTDLDGDGDAEVLLYAVTGSGIYAFDQGASGPRAVARLSLAPRNSAFRGQSFLGGTGSARLIDTDGDGRDELYAPLLPLRMLTMRTKPGVPLDVPLVLGGWRLTWPAEGGLVEMMEGWPRRMEDLMVLAQPSGSDVDGDGRLEVLMGSGGYLLHAFRTDGGEAAGFPKFTGGWTFSAPASGDLDGDGRSEAVTVTREGYLFAWETSTSTARAGTPEGGTSLPSLSPRIK